MLGGGAEIEAGVDGINIVVTLDLGGEVGVGREVEGGVGPPEIAPPGGERGGEHDRVYGEEREDLVEHAIREVDETVVIKAAGQVPAPGPERGAHEGGFVCEREVIGFLTIFSGRNWDL